MYTASFAFFEALTEAGVEYVFVNLGSDHPSILEAMVKGQQESEAGSKFPKIITCPNEMVALSAAHAMAITTGHIQAVIVHVDVGTQGLAAAIHNASMGRVPVLIFAGLSPFTIEGEHTGSRTEFIHWIQDVHDQRAIVAQYCRYTAEIKTGKNIKQMVNRAISFATSDPKGPVYLVGAREVMEQEIEPYKLDQNVWTAIQPAALPADEAKIIADALLKAKDPLIIVGYSGRNQDAVKRLVELADFTGARVLDTLGSDLCFPANHRGYLGVAYGAHDRITEADVILLLDVDVPYIQTRCKPRNDAIMFHVDVDPLKQQMPVFYVAAQKRYRADASTALKQINEYITSITPAVTISSVRAAQLDAEFETREKALKIAEELELPNGQISTHYLMAQLREKLKDKNPLWLIEAVTMTGIVFDHLKPTECGSVMNSGAGGLGWFGGAAVGAALGLKPYPPPKLDAKAIEKARMDPNFNPEPDTPPSKFITAIVGDGTFLFGVPSSFYWMSARYKAPFLTIVLNNSGWNAPQRSAVLVHESGLSSQSKTFDLNIEIARPSPDFSEIAIAAAGGRGNDGTAWLYGAKITTVQELLQKLPEAIAAVESGRSAVLDCHIVGSGFKIKGKD
ncbi:thiamine pyrophosphate enzyme, N-terminal TPP binding domain-containing protein [Pyronema omphalodes]|nr:thiamine pyrophosphate enzyme, N-terminal TPP binding domain-containing protein [Pyronema omphalodes]